MSKPKKFLYAIKYMYVHKVTGEIKAPTRKMQYKLNHWYSIGDVVPTLCVKGFHFPNRHNILSHDLLDENWYKEYREECNNSYYEMKIFLVKVSGIFDVGDSKICSQEILIVKDIGFTNKKLLEQYVRELIAEYPNKTIYENNPGACHYDYSKYYSTIKQCLIGHYGNRFIIK